MGLDTTILPCPRCLRRLRVPIDRGELVLTCPECRHRWEWSPEGAVPVLEDVTRRIRDPRLVEALRAFEEFERREAEARAEARRRDERDLWDEWLDGPRPGGSR